MCERERERERERKVVSGWILYSVMRMISHQVMGINVGGMPRLGEKIQQVASPSVNMSHQTEHSSMLPVGGASILYLSP